MDNFWTKKTKISYLLSILVFWIHISSFANYNISDNRFCEIFQIIFTNTINPIAVPLFFIISGGVFYRNYTNASYISKMKSRVYSLVIPYLVWNVLALLFNFLITITPVKSYISNRELFEISLPNILNGVFLYKYNRQFWFIFDLIIFQLLSPIIYKILNNKVIGISSIIILAILCEFDIGIPEIIFLSKTSIIYYFIGAYIGIHYFPFFSNSLHKEKSTLRKLYIVILGILICISFVKALSDITFPILLEIFFLSSQALLLWKVSDCFINRINDFSFFKNSFLVYAMHVNVSAIITKLLYIILPKSSMYSIVNFVITTILTLVFIELFALVIKRFNMKIYRILSGNR